MRGETFYFFSQRGFVWGQQARVPTTFPTRTRPTISATFSCCDGPSPNSDSRLPIRNETIPCRLCRPVDLRPPRRPAEPLAEVAGKSPFTCSCDDTESCSGNLTVVLEAIKPCWSTIGELYSTFLFRHYHITHTHTSPTLTHTSMHNTPPPQKKVL